MLSLATGKVLIRKLVMGLDKGACAKTVRVLVKRKQNNMQRSNFKNKGFSAAIWVKCFFLHIKDTLKRLSLSG
jgi:hypothetical protein